MVSHSLEYNSALGVTLPPGAKKTGEYLWSQQATMLQYYQFNLWHKSNACSLTCIKLHWSAALCCLSLSLSSIWYLECTIIKKYILYTINFPVIEPPHNFHLCCPKKNKQNRTHTAIIDLFTYIQIWTYVFLPSVSHILLTALWSTLYSICSALRKDKSNYFIIDSTRTYWSDGPVSANFRQYSVV